MNKQRLPKEQERRLISKVTGGDFGPGKWSTIQALIKNGYLVINEAAGTIVVTPKGKAYSDEYHSNAWYASQ